MPGVTRNDVISIHDDEGKKVILISQTLGGACTICVPAVDQGQIVFIFALLCSAEPVFSRECVCWSGVPVL